MESKKNNKSAVWRTALILLLGMALFFACSEEGNGKGAQEVNVQDSGRHGNSGGLSMEDYPYELGTFEGLDAETEWQILVDSYYWFDKIEKISSGFTMDEFFDCFSINGYYGTHNSYIVFDVGPVPGEVMFAAIAIPSIEIADGYIPQSPVFKTLAWKNGKIYYLEKLYNHGLLTFYDMRNIASIHPRWKPIEGQ